MGAMSELDLSLRELIFEGTLEENIKANVGTEIKIRCWSTYKNLRIIIMLWLKKMWLIITQARLQERIIVLDNYSY